MVNVGCFAYEGESARERNERRRPDPRFSGRGHQRPGDGLHFGEEAEVEGQPETESEDLQVSLRDS